MQQAFESSEQRFSQISTDLLNRMAEIQTLRELIEAAEASGADPIHDPQKHHYRPGRPRDFTSRRF